MKDQRTAEIENVAYLCGFALEESKKIAEIDGYAHILRHETSGARLIYLDNEDTNRSFSISFKTPPSDSTGVFHILEHSVLCGSKKYPVKEPFVNLLKSSMQTFLNAMTFPDKTVYPVASTNETDLENLMNVYLDAVFNPLIYDNELIFRQEGWHKEQDGGKLDFSGVVYNEMKGALSDPDSVLMDALAENLYQGSCYSFESGGKPSDIPNLSYEEFLNFHKRHYAPSNAYIILYGKLDLKRFLSTISFDYLVPAAEKYKSVISDKLLPNSLGKSSAVVSEPTKIRMATTESAACAGIAYRGDENLSELEKTSIDLVLSCLMASNVSPLKSRLIASGIADEFYYCAYSPVEQPSYVFCMQGMKSDDALSKFERVLRESLTQLVREGFDRELIEAALNRVEIAQREHNKGVADGVAYALEILSKWLYTDDDPCEYICYESRIAQLREMAKTQKFEEIIEKNILNNPNCARCEIVADANYQTQMPEGWARDLDNDEISRIDSEVATLNEAQSRPDTQENLFKLPTLSVDDIDKEFKRYDFDVQDVDGVKNLFYKDLETKGIAYFYLYFNCGDVDEEKLQYLVLMSNFFGKFDTVDYTAEQIELLSRKWAGTFYFSNNVVQNDKDGKTRFYLKCTMSCLDGNEEHIFRLADSVLHRSVFDDDEKIATMLLQAKIAYEQAFVNSGHVYSTLRANSYFSEMARVREITDGISYYRFICDLCENLESGVARVKSELASLMALSKVKSSFVLSSTCDDKTAREAISLLDLSDKSAMAKDCLSVSCPSPKNEAFGVKSDVTFTSTRNHFKRMSGDASYSGKWVVASRVLSYDYLWNTVRVKGGAYGCGFDVDRSGSAGFYSYRDPNVAGTLDTFASAGSWMSNFAPSSEEFEGYVVSTVAGIDEPKKPSRLILRGDAQYFSGLSEEDRQKIRSEVLSSKTSELNALGDVVSEVAKTGVSCTIGNRRVIEDSGRYDDIIDL